MELTLSEAAPATERDLILRAQAGDSSAFGELVQRHMRRAYFAALGLVGRHEDALDLSQEAFVRSFRARRTIDAERPFYTWLYQILRRLCFNHVRDSRTRRQKLHRFSDWLVTGSDAGDPLAAVERDETRRRVQSAIERLGERDREVLVLKEFEGLRYREIADLLGIPIGTVMSRLYAARRRLAELLEMER